MTIDAAIPSVTTQKVTQVISPLGSFPKGGAVDLPPVTGDAEIILFADDANNNIVMAQLVSATTGSKTFSVTSTALALCRLMQGALPDGLTGSQVDSAIMATPEFPHLVSLLNADYAPAPCHRTIPPPSPACRWC
ncbi:MAG: hypothetical protein WDN06_11170 [Asticcacaulis sp.]